MYSSTIGYIVEYTILQALLRTCCTLIEEESNEIIASMPENQREHAPVQLTLHDRDNKTVQLWHAINSVQLELVKAREKI